MENQILGFNTDKEWDYENGFYLTSNVKRMAKMLAHFDLYKTIIGLPGDVVECGVYKGASLIRFATFREILESPYSRKIVGFDAFGKFPSYQEGQESTDKKFIEKFEKEGGSGISINELEKSFSYKKFTNYELIKGDVLITIPQYIDSHPELKIALLHIDVDVYKPSLITLSLMWDRVVKGGLIILDDYGMVAGATKAVDEFLARKNILIEKLPISHIPAFIRI